MLFIWYITLTLLIVFFYYISITYIHVYIYFIFVLSFMFFFKKYSVIIYSSYINFYWVFMLYNISFLLDVYYSNFFNDFFNIFYTFNIF